MKRTLLTFILLLIVSGVPFAQTQSFNSERANMKLNDSRFPSGLPATYVTPQAHLSCQFRPNQVLVKFKDSSVITTRRNKKGRLVAANSKITMYSRH